MFNDKSVRSISNNTTLDGPNITSSAPPVAPGPFCVNTSQSNVEISLSEHVGWLAVYCHIFFYDFWALKTLNIT